MQSCAFSRDIKGMILSVKKIKKRERWISLALDICFDPLRKTEQIRVLFPAARRLQKRKAALITTARSAAVNHAKYTRICGRMPQARHGTAVHTGTLSLCLRTEWMEILRSVARALRLYLTIHLLFRQLRCREIARSSIIYTFLSM